MVSLCCHTSNILYGLNECDHSDTRTVSHFGQERECPPPRPPFERSRSKESHGRRASRQKVRKRRKRRRRAPRVTESRDASAGARKKSAKQEKRGSPSPPPPPPPPSRVALRSRSYPTCRSTTYRSISHIPRQPNIPSTEAPQGSLRGQSWMFKAHLLHPRMQSHSCSDVPARFGSCAHQGGGEAGMVGLPLPPV